MSIKVETIHYLIAAAPNVQTTVALALNLDLKQFDVKENIKKIN